MKNHHKKLVFADRISIQNLLKAKQPVPQIATILGVNKTTIYRELERCKTGKYVPLEAHHKAVSISSNRKFKKGKFETNSTLYQYVTNALNNDWSPEQISLRLKRDFPQEKNMHISMESIYNHIYIRVKPELKAVLIDHLRQQKKRRGKVGKSAPNRGFISDRIFIDERPAEVKSRLIPGHWEGDLIMGKERQSAIGTLNERTTRAVILVHLKARDAKTVREAFEKEFKTIPRQMKKTLTYDNGSEMAQHVTFTKNTKIDVYFAHPYSPQERPTNENSNGLIRQYFPKGTDLSQVTKKELKEVQNKLNNRPRKVLDMQTPKEVFDKLIMQNFKSCNAPKL